MICIIILYEVTVLLAAYVPSFPEHYRKLDSVSHGLYLKPLNQFLQEFDSSAERSSIKETSMSHETFLSRLPSVAI